MFQPRCCRPAFEESLLLERSLGAPVGFYHKKGSHNSISLCMSELEQNLVLNARLLPIFPGPCCEVFANLYIVRPSNKKQHRRCSTFTQPQVKNTHQIPLSGRARQNTDTKRYKTRRNLHRIQRQCHRQEGPGQLRGCLLQ